MLTYLDELLVMAKEISNKMIIKFINAMNLSIALLALLLYTQKRII